MLAGVSVGVVALPLALAFSISAGLGAAAGLITATVAGIVAAVFGGSSVQVSGPTGAMSVVLAPIVAQFGAEAVAPVAIGAGVLLVVGGVGKIGRLVGFLPWPVIEGFTVGIGAIIFLQQVPALLGVAPADVENTALRAVDAVAHAGGANWQAVAIAALVAGLMFVLPRVNRTLPSSLLAVLVATLVAQISGVHVAEIGAIPAELPAPRLPSISADALTSLLSATLAVAALAAIESLLSARVADGMSDTESHDPDRELFGQGLANISAALFGGMPATGAIARTAVNVQAGARTRASAIVHGVLILLSMLLLAPLIARIPLAALAGVLMVTAAHMVEFGTVARILRSTRGDAFVLVATASATIVFDLVVAVIVGIVLAGLFALHSVATSASFERDDLSGESIDAQTEHELLSEHVVAYRLDGALFFGAAQRFLLELADVSDVEVVILRCGRLRVLDASGAQALADIVTRLQHRGITVLLACLRPEHHRLISQIGVLDALEHEDRSLPTIHDALAWTRLNKPNLLHPSVA